MTFLNDIESQISSTKSEIAETQQAQENARQILAAQRRFTPVPAYQEAQNKLNILNVQLSNLEQTRNALMVDNSTSTKTSGNLQVTEMSQRDTRPQIISNNVIEKNNTNWILIALALAGLIIFGVMK